MLTFVLWSNLIDVLYCNIASIAMRGVRIRIDSSTFVSYKDTSEYWLISLISTGFGTGA